MTKTMEELKQEAEVLRAQIAEIEAQERAEKQRQADEQRRLEALKANAEMRTWKVPHAHAIVAELQKLGYANADYREGPEDTGNVEITTTGKFGYSDVSQITFDVNWSGGATYISRHRSKIPVIVVGGYNGNRYPLKKDGTFSYEKIAKTFDEQNQGRLARAKREATKKYNREASTKLAESLQATFNIPSWGKNGIYIRYTEYAPDKVVVEIKKTLTMEEALTLLGSLPTED